MTPYPRRSSPPLLTIAVVISTEFSLSTRESVLNIYAYVHSVNASLRCHLLKFSLSYLTVLSVLDSLFC
uniref:Putative ovule protein n=1 Tax=Solanum chacoense TaxID=4108 RepID=A0A0V0GXB2_SOLCH